MTACVNKKHSKRVAAVVAASLVGALSVAAPSVALAEGVNMLAVADTAWEGVSLKWSADADKFGAYSVEAGTPFLLRSATDPFGNPVSMSDVTVVYLTDANGNGQPNDDETVTTEAPKTAGNYIALVFNGAFDVKSDVKTFSQLKNIVKGANDTKKTQVFKVAAKSLDGAYAYEGTDVEDTSFKYLGKPLTVNYADAEGNKLTAGTDYDVTGVNAVENAGSYTATLKGKGKYSGTVTVKFTVDKIDLAKDSITIAPVAKGDIFSSGNLIGTTKVMVNGEALGSGAVKAAITSVIFKDGTVGSTSYIGNENPAKVTLDVSAAADKTANFVDPSAKVSVEMVVADELAKVEYDGDVVNEGDTKTFINSKGQKFDTSLLNAYLASSNKNVPFDVTVTKDGEEVTDFTAPGTYSVNVTVAIPGDLSYAGSVNFKVVVQAKQLSEQPKAYVAIDGKDIKTVEYDGEAVVPTVVVKAGSTELVQGEDYTLTYKDEDGKAVESVVEPGVYTATIDYLGSVVVNHGVVTPINDDTFTVTVTKAQLRSAKADQTVYDLVDGKAVAPTFTAYTKANCKGLSVSIDPAKVGVTYYAAQIDKTTGKPVFDEETGQYVTVGDPIVASDLDEAGWYVVSLAAPADDAHIEGALKNCAAFQVSEFAAFEDVDASAWYAQVVYKARDLGYMSGLAGTKLFMPEANITRSELAAVLFNMAGQKAATDENASFPTKFDDVDKDAWFAEPVSWASQAGVINGYDADSFGPFDNASREQVTCILYNYAKAQGKDVSVKDADAALAKYSDGASVSSWAKTAVAWAVENGVMGNGSELNCFGTITRAEVAAMAVNFQPKALA